MVDGVDLKDRAMVWFMENHLATYKDVSEKFDIPFDTVYMWGKQESWQRKRRESDAYKNYAPGVDSQAEQIRLVIFESIVNETFGDAKECSDLVKSWLSLVRFSVNDGKEEEFDQNELLDAIK